MTIVCRSKTTRLTTVYSTEHSRLQFYTFLPECNEASLVATPDRSWSVSATSHVVEAIQSPSGESFPNHSLRLGWSMHSYIRKLTMYVADG